MPLSAEQGFKIRESYSGEKEKEICVLNGLQQRGGSRTKIDGFSETERVSIKNASGGSTQVHLTTQAHFCKVLELPEDCVQFVKLFCGSADYTFKNRDRCFIPEIEPTLTEAFRNFLYQNKEKVIDLIIRNGFDITDIIYNDLSNKVEYRVTYEQVLEKIKDAEWKFIRGGIHLKLKGKTLFHFQREGKRSKSNRYNVLWHIHRNLFQ